MKGTCVVCSNEKEVEKWYATIGDKEDDKDWCYMCAECRESVEASIDSVGWGRTDIEEGYEGL